MSDSPTALETYGTSITAIKVIVFCIAAFLAGLGGALLGPVTKNSSPASYASFSSLTLLVVSVLAGRSEIGSSVIAAILLVVVPGYITNPSVNNYLPLAFAVGALLTALTEGGVHVPARLALAASATRRHPHRSPLLARARASGSPEPA
jgi:ABC-type branched-subunit amino acid transport system permease subunit